MKSISLRLQEQVFEDAENLIDQLKVSRNKYINEAIEFYNKYQKRKLLEEQLQKESAIVSEDSMKILGEFESLEDEI
jgi:metal-responsive CopG/Arc/MetJ family transcriptional regulator